MRQSHSDSKGYRYDPYKRTQSHSDAKYTSHTIEIKTEQIDDELHNEHSVTETMCVAQISTTEIDRSLTPVTTLSTHTYAQTSTFSHGVAAAIEQWPWLAYARPYMFSGEQHVPLLWSHHISPPITHTWCDYSHNSDVKHVVLQEEDSKVNILTRHDSVQTEITTKQEPLELLGSYGFTPMQPTSKSATFNHSDKSAFCPVPLHTHIKVEPQETTSADEDQVEIIVDDSDEEDRDTDIKTNIAEDNDNDTRTQSNCVEARMIHKNGARVRSPTISKITKVIYKYLYHCAENLEHCIACDAMIKGRQKLCGKQNNPNAIISYIEENVSRSDFICSKMFSYLLMCGRRLSMKNTIAHDKFIYVVQQRILHKVTYELFTTQVFSAFSSVFSDNEFPVDPGLADHLVKYYGSVNCTQEISIALSSVHSRNTQILNNCLLGLKAYILSDFATEVRKVSIEQSVDAARAEVAFDTHTPRTTKFDKISTNPVDIRLMMQYRTQRIQNMKMRFLQSRDLIAKCLGKPEFHSMFLLVTEDRIIEDILQRRYWVRGAELIHVLQRIRIAAKSACAIQVVSDRKESNQCAMRLVNPIPRKCLREHMVCINKKYPDVENNTMAVKLKYMHHMLQYMLVNQSKKQKPNSGIMNSLKTLLSDQITPTESAMRTGLADMRSELMQIYGFTSFATSVEQRQIEVEDILNCAITADAIDDAMTHNFIIFEHIVVSTCRTFIQVILNIYKVVSVPGRHLVNMQDTIKSVCNIIIRSIAELLHKLNVFKASTLDEISEYENYFLGDRNNCDACKIINAGHYTQHRATHCISERCLSIGTDALQLCVPHIAFASNVAIELDYANMAGIPFPVYLANKILFIGEIATGRSLNTLEKFIACLRASIKNKDAEHQIDT